MLKITATEFRRHLGKYIILAENERIEITKYGKTIFTLVPENKSLTNEVKSFFNLLPKDATIGVDPYERG